MNWRFKLSIRLALLRGTTLAACVLAACGGDNGITANEADPLSAGQTEDLRHSVASIVISPAAPTLLAGTSTQLTAVLKDAWGKVLTGRTITWVSAEKGVATVSATGAVTGVAAGQASISATSGSITARVTATVTTDTVAVAPAPVASISITPATSSVVTGASVQLTAVLRDAGGNILSGRTIAWASSAVAVVAVSATGLATGMGDGTATISATSGTVSATAQVTSASTVAPPPSQGGILTPNVFSNESFETGYGQFTNGSGGTPSGVTRDGTHPHDGAFAMRRAVARSGWAITSVTPASPAVIFVPGHGLTSGQRVGIYSTSDAGFNVDYYAYQSDATKARFARVIDVDHIAIYQDAAFTIPVASNGGTGGTLTISDVGPTVWKFWSLGGGAYDSYDRVQFRFYFYFDGHGTSPFKFQIYEHGALSGEQFGGFYVINDQLRWYMFPEFVQDAQQFVNIAPMTAMENGWHSLEVDHRRNGTATPEVRIWLDDRLVTRPSSGAVPAPATWNATTGVLNYGKRTSSTKIGSVNVAGIQNRGNMNAYNVWIDRVSLNTGDPGTSRLGQ